MDKDTRDGIEISQDIVDTVSDMVDVAIGLGDWSKLPFHPKKSCGHCWGKGRVNVGYQNTKTGERFTREQHCYCLQNSINSYFNEHSILELVSKEDIKCG